MKAKWKVLFRGQDAQDLMLPIPVGVYATSEVPIPRIGESVRLGMHEPVKRVVDVMYDWSRDRIIVSLSKE